MRTVDLLASLVKNMDVRNYTTTFGINVFADLDMDQVKSRVYQCCAGVLPQTISL